MQVTDLAKIARTIEGKIVPVFVTDIRRTTRLLNLRDNTIVEAAFDEGNIEAGAASEAVSELELELKGGSVGPLYELAVQLQSLAPFWISTESKSARGWHLRTGQTEGPTEAQTPKLDRRVRAANGFREIIGETLGHLTCNIGPTLRGDAEGVHQMRTALRASRAALEFFAPWLDAAAVQRFDAELQGFGRLFGAARDWDVFCLETLPAAILELPEARLHDMRPAAEARRLLAQTVVADAVCGRQFVAMVLGLAAWTEERAARQPILGDEGMHQHLASLAPSLLDRVEGKVKQRQHHKGKLSAEARHGIRKALDKLCDDVRFLTRLFPHRELERYRDRCEDVQVILGVANDAEVAQQLALGLAEDRRRNLAKPATTLARWSARRSRKSLRGLKTALEVFRATPVFWR